MLQINLPHNAWPQWTPTPLEFWAGRANRPNLGEKPFKNRVKFPPLRRAVRVSAALACHDANHLGQLPEYMDLASPDKEAMQWLVHEPVDGAGSKVFKIGCRDIVQLCQTPARIEAV
jgi:hypothetical protein